MLSFGEMTEIIKYYLLPAIEQAQREVFLTTAVFEENVLALQKLVTPPKPPPSVFDWMPPED